MEGVIDKSYALQPRRSKHKAEYSKIVKGRLAQSREKPRQAMVQDTRPKKKEGDGIVIDDEFLAKPSDKVGGGAGTGGGKGAKGGKRKRQKTEDELKSAVFQAFASADFLPFKELAEIVGDDSAVLRGILEDLCDLHRQGSNYNCYELKAEYRGAGQAAEGDDDEGGAKRIKGEC
jgi:hypothetical protein